MARRGRSGVERRQMDRLAAYHLRQHGDEDDAMSSGGCDLAAWGLGRGRERKKEKGGVLPGDTVRVTCGEGRAGA